MNENRCYTIAQALVDAAQILRQAAIPNDRMEAASLLGHVLGRSRTYLLAHAEEALTGAQVRALRAAVTRRAKHEPFAYIVGHKEFFSLDFAVTPAVLIPRPETEILVEAALEILRRDFPATDENAVAPVICDVGTGSGCIAVSLLVEDKRTRAIALDTSPVALAVAQNNAARHLVSDRCEFIESDLFNALDKGRQKFDMLVSNPPYIAAAEMPTLQPDVREHEPHAALTDNADGLEIIRRLLHDAPPFLKPNGYLLMEIGYDQHEAVWKLSAQNGWTHIATLNDLQHIPRCVIMRKEAGGRKL